MPLDPDSRGRDPDRQPEKKPSDGLPSAGKKLPFNPNLFMSK